MNILSLFDGISCGQLAAVRAGLKIDKYFASENNTQVVKVTQRHFPETIQLGGVETVKGEDLPKIDLLIGGSPCQGFSFLGNQLNFAHPKSKLFFEYVRILREVKPKYFLLENVKMQKKFQDIISEALGVEPILINSNLVSAQNRQRLYWTNIPDIQQPKDQKIFMTDIVAWSRSTRYPKDENKPSYVESRERRNGKANTLVTGKGCSVFSSVNYIEYSNGQKRQLTVEECEMLQNIPVWYTEGISLSQRYGAVGNGFTVDVVAHILRNITKEV